MFKCICGQEVQYGSLAAPWVCECGLAYGISVDQGALMRRVDDLERRVDEIEKAIKTVWGE